MRLISPGDSINHSFREEKKELYLDTIFDATMYFGVLRLTLFCGDITCRFYVLLVDFQIKTK